MDDFFSPFDALGLDPDDLVPEDLDVDPVDYAEKRIRKAFRAASLHSHPDRREAYGIPPTQWPTQQQLEASRDYLLQKWNSDRYRGYLRTFFPKQVGEAAYTRSLGSPPFDVCTNCARLVTFCPCKELSTMSFSICTSCRMVLPSECLKRHQRRDHGMCKHCEQFPPDAYEHICQEHRNLVCKICGTVDVRMMKHVVELHSLPDCEVCEDYESGHDIHGFVRHIQSHPSCPLCPDKTYPTGGLWQHLSEEHAILRCPACPKTESELSKAAEHIKEHEWELCPDCEGEQPFIHTALQLHLVLEHGWTPCPYCASAMVGEEHLEEHLAEH